MTTIKRRIQQLEARAAAQHDPALSWRDVIEITCRIHDGQPVSESERARWDHWQRSIKALRDVMNEYGPGVQDGTTRDGATLIAAELDSMIGGDDDHD